MRIHPTISQLNGVVKVTLQSQFVGDATDADDQARIQAYGDPLVNLGGTFTDPLDPTFHFRTGSSLINVGITGELHNNPVRFMASLPSATIGAPNPVQEATVVVTNDPVRAVTLWTDLLAQRILDSFTVLRELPDPITSLPDSNV